MDFIDQLKQFAKRVEGLKDTIHTEEATKTSIIMPFFSLLGFDVFNPQEFLPEFTADVGIKKGEKVDYAILQDGQPVILIEAKSVNENLEQHDSQLFRYFGTTKAKFAILTNGIIYRFYTDLEEPNKMDVDPFLEINILDLKESQVPELKKFQKANFDIDEILTVASELKYSNEIKKVFEREMQNPSDDFVKFFLSNMYTGMKTQAVIDKFRGIIKLSLSRYINEMMNDKIKNALNVNTELTTTQDKSEPENLPEKKTSKVETTEEELEAYFIVKNLLKDSADMDDITYKDTESYINILYKNNVRKWICRLILTPTVKYLIIPDENKKEIRHPIHQIYDIEQYKENLLEVLKRY